MLIEQVGKKWAKFWPKLCDDAYLASLHAPDDLDPSNLNEEWRRFLRIGEFAMVRLAVFFNRVLYLSPDTPKIVLQREDEPIDLDQLLRESDAMDDPTIRKNEWYHRTVRDPEHQMVECHIPGKPFVV